jgi:DNA-binding transcriptional regulator YdaS (Cro superfamily)
MSDKALQLAKEKAGGVVALAADLGIKPPSVSKWRRIPVGRVLQIENLYGIPRHVQRPDIYPPPKRGK